MLYQANPRNPQYFFVRDCDVLPVLLRCSPRSEAMLDGLAGFLRGWLMSAPEQ